MTSDLLQTTKALATAQAFFNKYAKKFPQSVGYVTTNGCYFDSKDCTTVAKIFGKTGWTRKINYGGTAFDWQKTIDGLTVTISSAEPNEFNNSPVPEKSWPVLLEETTASSGNDYSAFEQYDTSAT